MSTYIKPQVLVYQEFQATASATDTDLRAWIVGPNGVTHKRGTNTIGDYSDVTSAGLETTFPDIDAGSLIDEDSVKVCVDDATLQYAHVEAVELTAGATIPSTTVCAYNKPGTPNCIKFNNFNLADSGDNSRNADLGNRDVQPGDKVILSAYAATIPGVTECQDVTFETRVLDVAVTMKDSYVGTVVRKTNQYSPTTSQPTTQTGTISGTYAGKMAEEVYTLNVTIYETNKAYYTVSSASGLDSYPATATEPVTLTGDDSGYQFTLGRSGLKYKLTTLPTATTSYTISVASASITSSNLGTGTGQTNPAERIDTGTNALESSSSENLTITGSYDPKVTGMLSQTYEITAIAKNNTNSCKNIEFRIISESGLDDTYKAQTTRTSTGYSFKINADLTAAITSTQFASIEVGDTWQYKFTGAYSPSAITAVGPYTGESNDTYIVTCVAGGTVGASDISDAPKVVIHTSTGSEYIGPFTVKATTTGSVTSASVTTAYGVTFTIGSGDMALNDTWIVNVQSMTNGPANILTLCDSLPEALRTIGTDYIPLDVKFCVVRDVEVPGVTIANKKLTVPYGAKVSVDDILEVSGLPQSLDIIDGKMSVEYREWSSRGTGKLNYIASTDELDSIPGTLEPSNPLKYALYKALSNSNGTTVAYTTVLGDTLDNWNEAFSAGVGSREVYTLVPLSQDIQVLNLAAAVISGDSDEETCAWKNGFFNVTAPTEIMRVGKSSSTLNVTSTDGNTVFATITKEANTTVGLVEITSKYKGVANASLTNVKAGDELRVFGTGVSYTSYVIDSVEGDTMTITGVSASVEVPTSIEVWHTFTRDEQVDYICDIAQSFSNRRIKLVWPDVVGEGSLELDGTMLCAALAGMSSGILPNQSMTRVSLSGFDDLTRSLGYFTDTQIKKLAASGVWCVIEDNDGTVYTMHALTTDTLSIQYSEEMMTRIVDKISFRIRDLLDTYIGTTNVTEDTIDSIGRTLNYYLQQISASNYNSMGPLLTSYQIVDVSQDSLLLDRINVTLNAVIVKCTNYIAVHIQAS